MRTSITAADGAAMLSGRSRTTTTSFAIALAMVAVLPVTSMAQQPAGRLALDYCYSVLGENGYEVRCEVAVLDLGASEYAYAAGFGLDPALSPDGTRLAFLSEASNQITVANLQTGTGGLVFSELGEWVASLSWSFDRRLAFTRSRAAGLFELWVMNADGTGLTQITGATGFRGGPSWSPDGRIAFACEIEAGNFDICTVHADGSSFTRLTNSERDESLPVFSPDGTRIAFTDAGSLSILNADGKVANLGVRGGWVTWSPDGTRLAFSVPWEGGCDADGRLCGYADIYTVNVDGSGPTFLTAGANPSWAMSSRGLPPFAYFTAQCAALVCTLDASLSSDDGSIVAYEWKFGDGTTATGKTPTHTYGHAGSFWVELTVIDDSGARSTLTRTLNVVEFITPIASFFVHCNGLYCEFDAVGSYDPDGIAAYSWTFGDGTSAPGGSYTIHRYLAAGTYTVTLSVRDSTGTVGTATKVVTVTNSRPTALIQFACDSLFCNFTGQGSSDLDGTIVSYVWNFGDGTQATGPSATHAFASPGSYSVLLTVTDNDGNSGTAAATVTVQQRFVHVGDLDAATNAQRRSWDAFVTIAIHDAAHQPLAKASITAVWSNGNSVSCTTDQVGTCTFALYGLPNSTPSMTFTVHSVVLGEAIYRANANHDADGETNGTSITVRKR